jgi:transcriptional regulator with XRE-family HTH domain
MVTQCDIARKLGYDPSTVNKILNGRSGLVFGKETIESVFQVAQELGYDFSRLRFSHRRRHPRRIITKAAELSLYYRRDGTRCGTGRCTIRNLSESGAFMAVVELTQRGLPMEPFLVGIRSAAWARRVELRGHVVRFLFRDGAPCMAIEFENPSLAAQAALRKALSQQVDKRS